MVIAAVLVAFVLITIAIVMTLGALPAIAQDDAEPADTTKTENAADTGAAEPTGGQSRESMAVDATASQWSFQFALEGNFDYKNDTMEDGAIRPEGNKRFLQFRLVAPITKSEKIPFTMLTRLTFRMVENSESDFGFGQSDLFILGIVNQWATGRWGIGPQINFPAKEGYGSTKWGFGLAGAGTERAMEDKLFLALLLQQVWSENSAGETTATPLGINPVIVYQLGKSYYIGNGDFVIKYDWTNGGWFVPLRLRVGKAWIFPEKTWNAYFEHGTALEFKSWLGPVPEHTFCINVQFQIPVG